MFRRRQVQTGSSPYSEFVWVAAEPTDDVTDLWIHIVRQLLDLREEMFGGVEKQLSVHTSHFRALAWGGMETPNGSWHMVRRQCH